MNWKTVILAVFGMGMMVAIVHPSSLETPAPVEAKAKTTVVVEKHTLPQQPDGYISEKQCATIPNGMQVADLVWKYGWPAGDYSVSAFAERLFYPVHDRRDDKCVIEYDDNKVVSTLYRDE